MKKSAGVLTAAFFAAGILILFCLFGQQEGKNAGEENKTDITDVMEVHFMDVGHGDATLIKCRDTALLIDTGDADHGMAVRDYLEEQGVSELDYLVLTIAYKNTRFLFTGDAGKQAEQDLTESGADLRADVYQAGHHGGKASSGGKFLDAVGPAWTVISCGADDGRGEPHEKVLKRLTERGIKVFRTDQQGTITAYSDGAEILWN